MTSDNQKLDMRDVFCQVIFMTDIFVDVMMDLHSEVKEIFSVRALRRQIILT